MELTNQDLPLRKVLLLYTNNFSERVMDFRGSFITVLKFSDICLM